MEGVGKDVEEDMRLVLVGGLVWLVEKPAEALLTNTVPVGVAVLVVCAAVLVRLVLEVARWDRSPTE